MIMLIILTKPCKKPDLILNTCSKVLKNIFYHSFTSSSKAIHCMLYNLLYGTYFSRRGGTELMTYGGPFHAL